MAQVTESLAREFLQQCERGHHPPMTIHETEQLILAWFKLDRYRKAINRAGALALQKASHERIRETLAEALSDV